MTHSFQSLTGFLIDTYTPPMHTAFLLVDDAAAWCSLEPRCRGFTISALHMQDDMLHHVRFYAHTEVVLSGDWMSYLKEATTPHSYTFNPGYLMHFRGHKYDPGAPTDNKPLHELRCTLTDAHRYCDAEPLCVGFSLLRRPPPNEAAVDTTSWVTFAGGFGRNVMSVFDGEHVAYVKGGALPPVSALTDAPHLAKLHRYSLQAGFLGGEGEPLRQAHESVAAGREWCTRHASCSGFSVEETAEEGPGHTLWLTFW